MLFRLPGIWLKAKEYWQEHLPVLNVWASIQMAHKYGSDQNIVTILLTGGKIFSTALI
jgi:hypothetical protein